MNPFCSNERDYHMHLIEHIDRLPELLKSESGVGVFVWGHEVKLLDAGSGGGDGLADLFTVDERGVVWLIEAKFGYNPELSRFVWERQLLRYRTAIARMSWQRLLHSCETFLKGREATRPVLVLPPNAGSFLDAIAIWHGHLGRAALSPEVLNEKIATALATGTYGIMVVADRFVPEVVEFGKAFVHNGPVAYVQALPTESGIEFAVRWFRPAMATGEPDVVVDPDPRFDGWAKERNEKCHPDKFSETLNPACHDLWIETLRPGLVQLGWTGKPAAVKQMAFNVAFDVNGRLAPLLVIGWSEADAKSVAREHKRAGQASMKVNLQIKRLLNFTNDIGLANRWAKRFHQIGWRARPKGGKRDRWGVEPVTEDEIRGAEGVLIYHPDDATRDHVGRPGDRESLEQLLHTLSEMLIELRR